MWKLPTGKTITHPRSIQIEDTKYPKSIFRRWSKEELNAIGIYPFREEPYDRHYYRTMGHEDVVTDGECVRTHTVTMLYTNAELKQKIRDILKATFMQYRQTVRIHLDYMLDFDEDNTEEIAAWQEYLVDLKAASVLIRDDIQALTSYDDAVLYIRVGWQEHIPTQPGAEVPTT